MGTLRDAMVLQGIEEGPSPFVKCDNLAVDDCVVG
jgi:hypothetical protein